MQFVEEEVPIVKVVEENVPIAQVVEEEVPIVQVVEEEEENVTGEWVLGPEFVVQDELEWLSGLEPKVGATIRDSLEAVRPTMEPAMLMASLLHTVGLIADEHIPITSKNFGGLKKLCELVCRKRNDRNQFSTLAATRIALH